MKVENLTTLATRIEVVNARLIEDGNVEKIKKYFSENYVVHFGGLEKNGHGTIRGFTKALHNAFSDLRVDVEIFLESGNRISWQRCIKGKQTGAFQGFPASGHEINWCEMVVSEFEGKRIAREWLVTDLAEALLRSRKR